MISLLNDGSPNLVCLKFYVLQWNMVNKKRHSSRVYRPSSQMMFPQSSVLSPLRSPPLQTNCCPYQSDITSPHPNHHPQVSSRHPSPWSGLLRAVIVSVLVKLLKLRWKVLCLSFCKPVFIYQNMYLDMFQASHNIINSTIFSYLSVTFTLNDKILISHVVNCSSTTKILNPIEWQEKLQRQKLRDFYLN